MTNEWMQSIEEHESAVRSYVRSFPTVFARAQGAWLYDTDGRAYLDFFCGASVLNYGHNHPELKRALLDYLSEDGIVHSLDMASPARGEFLATFQRLILEPRGLRYRVQFPGPTGTNAVEAALKIARKVTGRHNVLTFTNAFHGMTLGALAVTGNAFKRAGAGIPLGHNAVMPYGESEGLDSIEHIDRLLSNSSSGVDLPAAAIVETVQGEGGLNTAPPEWLRRLEGLCRRHGMLLIVDDIQAGNGRTGTFFSFEPAGIEPDVVTISKSLSGFGLPFALTLIKPEHDVWAPGEHNGTFRGHNPALITARRALEVFWSDDRLERAVGEKAGTVTRFLETLTRKYPAARGRLKGRGLMQGVEFAHPELAGKVSEHAFRNGLVIETSGADDEVLKLLPPLTIDPADLQRGLEIIDKSLAAAMAELGLTPQDPAAGQ